MQEQILVFAPGTGLVAQTSFDGFWDDLLPALSALSALFAAFAHFGRAAGFWGVSGVTLVVECFKLFKERWIFFPL